MKRIVIFLVLIAAATGSVFALDARAIVQKMREQTDQDSVQARIVAELKTGDQISERMIDQYSVRIKGLRKAVAVFQKPAAVKDTRFLVIQNEGRDDDRWIYLPALKKVRRIAAGEGSTSFIGEFTYDDVSPRSVDRDNFELLGEENMGGEACFVIISSPKVSGDGQYSKTKSWISKEKFLPVRAEFYDKSGSHLKTSEIIESKQIQDIWSMTAIRMTNVQTKAVTTLKYSILEYGKAIPEGVFTQKFLETGRP